MELYKMQCDEFTEAISSKAPVPGGGGASAYAGAIGTALGLMVGSLTVGKKKYAAVSPQIEELMEKAEELRLELLELIQADAQAFEPLSAAYGLPKSTPEEMAYKEQVMEKALYDASLVPLAIMDAGCRATELMQGFAEMGSVIAISDAGVGAAMLRACISGASLNVFINTRSMKDRAQADALNAQANEMLEKYIPMADQIFETVAAKLAPAI